MVSSIDSINLLQVNTQASFRFSEGTATAIKQAILGSNEGFKMKSMTAHADCHPYTVDKIAFPFLYPY